MMTDNDNLSTIRTHLEDQSTTYLVDLLMDLIQAVEEPVRQRFWERLAPPAMATADLRYASPEFFLTELQEFAETVGEGDYFDEEALDYFSEDPFDREYYGDRYGYYEDFDPAMHGGLNSLGDFLTEADSYFQAGQYGVAAEAYEIIIGIVDYSPEDTLGVYDPLAELGEMEEPLAQRYFTALKESCAPAEFYDKALLYLARHDAPYHKHMDNFIALVGSGGQAQVQAYLEQWADELAQKRIEPFPIGVPFQFRLLIRFYTEANQPEKVLALQKRFRRIYLAFYEPLLNERETAEDWSMVITYGREVLALLSQQEGAVRPYLLSTSSVDANKVRTQMARAYESLGDLENALNVYRPVFEQHRNFEHYAAVKRLATAVNPRQGEAFTAKVVDELQEQLPRSIYFLCQVYLSEDRFDAAYALAKQQSRYNNLETIKLVAKAHLLAGLGPTAAPGMGAYSQDLYAKVERAAKEPVLFLRDHLPSTSAIDKKTAVSHAEALYQNVMQLHIDNGRKTYATAAYYCALLGEIAAYDGRVAEFKQFYQELLDRYPRHRALRQELAAKVKI
jgi:tetratricopeptide (TPR) repeat protein